MWKKNATNNILKLKYIMPECDIFKELHQSYKNSFHWMVELWKLLFSSMEFDIFQRTDGSNCKQQEDKINLSLSIIALNGNGLNIPIKGRYCQIG